MRLAVFELALFDATIVPAAATNAIFFVGFLIDLTIIIIRTDPLILHAESLGDKMAISDVSKAHWWQLVPFPDGAR